MKGERFRAVNILFLFIDYAQKWRKIVKWLVGYFV